MSPPSIPRVHRFTDGPMIDESLDPSIGSNIQGPSMIRVPEWIEAPLGAFYLYFADHKGSYIRLAYANDVGGPWIVHRPGSLQLADSLFLTEPPMASDELIERIEQAYERVLGPDGLLHDVRTEVTTPHIASPDVHVDHDSRQIIMYFHGLEGVARQCTRMAASDDGIEFETQPALIEPTYLRVFEVGDTAYGLTMPGRLHRLANGVAGGLDGIEDGPLLFNPNMRHAAVEVVDGGLRVYWTQVGDTPERILLSTIDTAGPWSTWRASEPVEVLRPQWSWEGADARPEPSRRSLSFGLVNQLRDPAIFHDDAATYLLYALGGESGIGVVELLDD